MSASTSLWDDPTFKVAFDNLSHADKLHYQKLGEEMYNTINFQDPKVTEFNYAMKIELMLRDGLKVDELSLSEKQIYTDAYGLNSLMRYENNDVDQQNIRQVSQNSDENRRDKGHARNPKKRGKKSKHRT